MAEALGVGRRRGRGRGRMGGGMGNGGVTAPPVQQRQQIERRQAQMPPGGGAGAGAPHPSMGLGGQAVPGPGGRQLEARVQAGKITSDQAQRTIQQRQTLEKAFGPNWRGKLSVGGQSFAQVRQGLAKNPGNAKLAALNKRLLANRKAMLEAARQKIGGGGAGEGQE